jgi:hypothetical protein
VCVSDLQSVVPSGVYKWSIDPICNPYPVYSHTTLNRENILDPERGSRTFLRNVGELDSVHMLSHSRR